MRIEATRSVVSNGGCRRSAVTLGDAVIAYSMADLTARSTPFRLAIDFNSSR